MLLFIYTPLFVPLKKCILIKFVEFIYFCSHTLTLRTRINTGFLNYFNIFYFFICFLVLKRRIFAT